MIAVADLRFRYEPGAEELFGGLDHAFAAGAVTAVTGASGRGKSTLLSILGPLLAPTVGSVILEDVSTRDLGDSERARLRATSIGFVFQDAALDPSRTILDAVVEPALYAGHRRVDVVDRARNLLAGLGVDHRAEHRPGEISGGQAQRVAVCRALVNDPSLVLADEPTGNLDRDNGDAVLDALARASSTGRTVVIASHDPYVLNRADQVLELT